MASPPAAKQAKLEATDGEDLDRHPESFAGFEVDRVLNEHPDTKAVFVQGHFAPDPRPAIVVLEKTPFGDQGARSLTTEATRLDRKHRNDVYGTYLGYPPSHLNDIKVTIIHPATEKHIEKYSCHPACLVKETAETYRKITLPHLEKQQFSLQWVYNILNHESEADRIVAEDADPDVGFVLLPDMKWDGLRTENLYVMALVRRRDLKSLRDLTARHLPLLRNIRDEGRKVIEKKYGVAPDQLRIYFHYQPSYYHLHVHFTALTFAAPGTGVEKAHLLDTVIGNLELMPDYYQKATLVYALRENDPLLRKLREADVGDSV